MTTPSDAAVPESPPGPIRVTFEGEGAILHLEGVVGSAQANRLHQLAVTLAGSGRSVHVRCDHLLYLDCAAVQVLLALEHTVKTNGARMTVGVLPQAVQQMLQSTGLASAW